MKLNGTIIWKLLQENSRGQAEKVLLGNSVEQTYGYTATGTPTWRKASLLSNSFQNFMYTFDEIKGLLMSRKDMVNNKAETFAYDNLKRLTQHNDYQQNQITYNSMGSPTRKTDVGVMAYNVANKPYAIGQVRQNTGSIPIHEQQISYSSFDRPISISENDYQASFTYNAAGDRKFMAVSQNSTLMLSRYYLSDCYEKDIAAGGVQTERLYLGGSAYNAPAVWVKENGQEKLLYIHRDYLGSITHLSDATGIKVAEYSYDAWGRLRNPATLQPYDYDEQPALMLGRGYTGHEHLPWFGLINMNARLYDPILGRFLAPDPYVQLLDFSQSFNRYSYGLNNPLMYIDQDGEFWHIVVGFAVGAVVNWVAHGAEFSWDGLKAAGIGGLSGAAGAATGGWAFGATGGSAIAGSGGFLAGSVSAGASFLSSTAILSIGNHMAFGDPLPTTIDILKGTATSMFMGGIMGGLNAVINGRDFWTGNEISPTAPPAPMPKALPSDGKSTVDLKVPEREMTRPEPIKEIRSPKVQQALETLEDIKSQGGIVKVNPLSPSQELNMTMQLNGQKLDIRIETHIVQPRYGGNGVTPQRHLNVDLKPRPYPRFPNNGHKLLPDKLMP